MRTRARKNEDTMVGKHELRLIKIQIKSQKNQVSDKVKHKKEKVKHQINKALKRRKKIRG